LDPLSSIFEQKSKKEAKKEAKMSEVLLTNVTAADIALVTRDIQARLRSRFPGLESVIAFDELDATQIDATRLETSELDAAGRMLVLWLTYGDAAEMQHDAPKRAALTGEERASCVVDTPFTQSAECAICLQSHAARAARAAQLRCGHTFCRACVSEWLERARTCPICRTDVVRDAAAE
jgi:hypothetical protein